VPGGIQADPRGLVDRLEPVRLEDHVQVVPVQHIELAEWQASASDLLHRRLVLIAPRICERLPLGAQTER
jgi:hypothetical protein